jgi:DNA-nicking Smr family endonuclease
MNDKEWDVFKESVKPIKKEGVTKTLAKKAVPRITSDETIVTTPDLETVLSKDWGALEKNTHKRILRNQIKISKKLDLHGRSVEESKVQIFKFITNNFIAQNRLLLIICGKGKRMDVSHGWQGTGVLNKKVPDWLNSKALFDKVLWFDYAKPEQGGKGAYIVYLKKIKE